MRKQAFTGLLLAALLVWVCGLTIRTGPVAPLPVGYVQERAVECWSPIVPIFSWEIDGDSLAVRTSRGWIVGYKRVVVVVGQETDPQPWTATHVTYYTLLGPRSATIP